MSPGRRALALVHAAGLAFMLGGCAGLPGFQKAQEDEPPAAEATGGHAIFALQVDAPRELAQLLLTYLDLARFQKLPATDTVTPSELDRLAAAAPSQARSLLETEGYFNAEVKVNRSTNAEGLILLRVSVAPGPRATVQAWSLDAVGELQQAVQADHEDAVVELAALRRRWPLKAGQPFRQVTWSDAKNVTLARLRAEGYPAATWKSTDAQVDARTNAVTLHVVADSGPLFRYGATRVEGLSRYDEQSVLRLSTFNAGEPYSEQALLDFQDRLAKSGLFEGAVVDIDPDPAHHEAAPVTVRVKEVPLQAATVGVGYSANTGPRLTLEHTHRRVFGTRWVARNKFELGPNVKSWDGQLTSHPEPNLYRDLVAGSAERLRSANELRQSWSARVGRTQETPRIDRFYFAEVTHSTLNTTAGVESSNAVSLNYHWTFRDLDNVLLPTKGFVVSVQGAVGGARGREIKPEGITEGRGPFTRTYGQLNWYLPLPGNWFARLRTEAGQVVARMQVGVPDTLLFRAGGDESVRGYAYRTLGPVVNGAVTSGRVLWTGTAEIARPISPSRPQIWWAAFVDAGNASDHWSDLHPAVGYGLGVRWRSPVGPLRVDLAYGEEVRRVRLHMSVGTTF